MPRFVCRNNGTSLRVVLLGFVLAFFCVQDFRPAHFVVASSSRFPDRQRPTLPMRLLLCRCNAFLLSRADVWFKSRFVRACGRRRWVRICRRRPPELSARAIVGSCRATVPSPTKAYLVVFGACPGRLTIMCHVLVVSPAAADAWRPHGGGVALRSGVTGLDAAHDNGALLFR